MSKEGVSAFKLIIIAECLVISTGNIFTIIVFWKNRKKLKRTSFLLINLAFADLLVGCLTPIAIDAFEFNYPLEEPVIKRTAQSREIFGAFQTAFSSGSVFFLVLIALERVYALMWPLRHRVASTQSYICSVISVWLAGIFVGGVSLLTTYDVLSPEHWIVALCAVVIFALIMICVSYMVIRRKLNCRAPAINEAHNNEIVQNQSKKLARTLFIVIAASLVFWFPSTVVYCVYFLCSRCFSASLLHISTMLHLSNSLVNPIIYSFRISMFKQTLKRMKLRKMSKQYGVHYRP